ncbi:MAG: hypothetical protein R8G34_16895 [Paracoccaceae bacterium]|nr:hypothetical protein [Paracoccaceae bacterium]
MTDIPLVGDQNFIAKKSLKYWVLKVFRRIKPAPKGLHIRRLNAHLARDIGLTEAEHTRYKLTLPSQTHHHPYG